MASFQLMFVTPVPGGELHQRLEASSFYFLNKAASPGRGEAVCSGTLNLAGRGLANAAQFDYNLASEFAHHMHVFAPAFHIGHLVAGRKDRFPGVDGGLVHPGRALPQTAEERSLHIPQLGALRRGRFGLCHPQGFLPRLVLGPILAFAAHGLDERGNHAAQPVERALFVLEVLQARSSTVGLVRFHSSHVDRQGLGGQVFTKGRRQTCGCQRPFSELCEGGDVQPVQLVETSLSGCTYFLGKRILHTCFG